MSKSLKIKFKDAVAVMDAISLQDLKNKIYEKFYINPEKLKIIKPPLKNQQAFKTLKQATQIVIMGTPEDKVIKQDPQQKYIATLDQQQKLTYLQKKRGIKQHGYKRNQDLGEVTYISSSLHLLRVIPQFRKYLKSPEKQQQTLKLFARDLDWQFSNIEDQTNERPISPIDIVFTFVSANEQIGQYPFYIHDPIWFFFYGFRTLQQGKRIVQVDDFRTKYNWINHHFMVQHNTLNDDYQPVQGEQKRLNDKRVQQRWWMICRTDDRAYKNIKHGLFPRRGYPERQEVFGFQIKFYQNILDICYLPPFMLIHIDRMVLKSQRRVIDDPNLADHLGRDFLKQNTHVIEYYKNIDFYDQCTPQIQKQLQQARKKRDQYFLPIKQSKQFKQFVNKLKNAKQLTQMQLLYAYKDHIMSNQQYDKFYGRQYDQKDLYKYRTGQYNLMGVLTHNNEAIDHLGYSRVFVQRSGKRWFRFDQHKVDIVPLEQVLSYKGNDKGNRKDQFAHMLIYKCIMWP